VKELIVVLPAGESQNPQP